jgi:hypothetical protein
MTEIETPTPAPPLRSCGECFVCCKALGVEELRKWPGQMCKHITAGDSGNALHRCGIYEFRPSACAKYSCGWRQGMGPEDARPDKAGLVISIYAREGLFSEVHDPNVTLPPIAATIFILDIKKTLTLQDSGPLTLAVDFLIRLGIEDIRIVDSTTKAVIHFLNGKIYNGKLLKSDDGYEELKFMTFNSPIGTFERTETDA